MPATARTYGPRVDSFVDERLDPAKSTNAALLYLKDLCPCLVAYNFRYAYNSGENKLNRVLCKEDANEYEAFVSRMLKRCKRGVPAPFPGHNHNCKESRKIRVSRIASNESDEKFELAPIQGSYSLDGLAHILGMSYADLLELNPVLVRGSNTG